MIREHTTQRFPFLLFRRDPRPCRLMDLLHARREADQRPAMTTELPSDQQKMAVADIRTIGMMPAVPLEVRGPSVVVFCATGR